MAKQFQIVCLKNNMDFRSLINVITEAEITNPYTTDADRAKFDAMTAADQQWLTASGGVPDINDEFILNRAPNKGQADPAKKQQGQAAQPVQTTNKTALQQKIEKLNQLVDQLAASRQAAPTTSVQSAAPTTSAAPLPAGRPGSPSANIAAKQGQAAQPATPTQSVTQNANGTFTAHKKDGSTVTFDKDGKILKESSIAKDLVESFGYQTNEAELSTKQLGGAAASGLAKAGLAKAGASSLAKLVPGAGSALSAMDAYNRWKEGDRSGAVISALAGIGWLVPGPMGWVLGGGLDAANIARDVTKAPGTTTATTPPASQSQVGDPKILALQKFLKSQGANLGTTGPNKDGVDGVMGSKTQAAMAQLNLTEAQRNKLNAILSEANPLQLGKAALNVGKNFVSGLKGGGLVQPMVKQAHGGALAGKAATGARTALKTGRAIGKHPYAATAAAAGAAGYGLGASGSPAPATSVATTPATAKPQTANVSKGTGQAAQPWTDEQKELNRQIKDLSQELQISAANDPEVKAALDAVGKKMAGINQPVGQGAQPAAPKPTSVSNQDFYNRVIGTK